MRDSLRSQNSFIFDRNWEKVNPRNELTVSVDQAKQFLKLLIQDHQKIKKINEINLEEINELKIMDKIQSFLFKYIQQKQLALSAKRELPTLQKAPYRLTLNDCLEIWRWLNQDSTSYKTKDTGYDESMNVNQFELGNNFEAIEIKKNVDYSSKNKKIFSQLSLDEQESVLKKSLEMVHMYYFQFKIIFNHYCKFTIENQHKRTNTFDDVSQSLQNLTINRFMLFCREFDIIKTLQFKRRTEQNPTMSKEFLLKIFRKNAYLQRYMNFENFLMTLVNISIKIHQNFDPRSFMHVEIFLNNLKVKYYEQFVKKLEALRIKYSPTQFYNCYRHIFNKQSIKRKKQGKKSIFNNPHFAKQQTNSKIDQVESRNIVQNSSDHFNHKVQSRIIKSHQSVPNLLAVDYELPDNRMRKAAKTLQKRKVSVPALPSLQENRYFKPIEHNHHLNIYNKYLEKVEDTSSVFKNRITGYTNINKLKTQGFHMTQNPQSISKQVFDHLITKKKTGIHNDHQQLNQYNLATSAIFVEHEQNSNFLKPKDESKCNQITVKLNQASTPKKVVEDKITLNQALMKQQLANSSSIVTKKQQINSEANVQVRQLQKIPTLTLTTSKLLEKQEKKQALQSLRQKIDVQEDDELLNKHLIAQQSKQREVNNRLIQVFKADPHNEMN